MVSPAQQVQQGFVIVFTRAMQCGAPTFQLLLEVLRIKALFEHCVTCQFVNHTRVFQQIAGRPTRCAQHVQQALVHIGAFQQQGQVTLAAQKRFDPVGQAHGRDLADFALGHPLRRTQHQTRKASAGLFPQCQYPRVVAPAGNAVAKLATQRGQQFVKIARTRCRRAGMASLAFLVRATQ